MKWLIIFLIPLLFAGCPAAADQKSGEVKTDVKSAGISANIYVVEHEGWRYVIFTHSHGCCTLRAEKIEEKK